MRRLLLLTTLGILVLTGCKKDDEKQNNLVPMRFYAYSQYDMESTPNKTAAKFFFFDASNGEKFKEETHDNPSGYPTDYWRIPCEMLTLLKNNQFELIDGTRVSPMVIKKKYSGDYYISVFPDIKDPDKWSNLLSENSMEIPEGKYYVVALSENYGSGWAHKDKYSGKYITVSKNMINDDKTISITFPHDSNINWITTSWERP